MAGVSRLLHRKVRNVDPPQDDALMIEVFIDGAVYSEHVLESKSFPSEATWVRVVKWASERGTLVSGPECPPAREVAKLLGLTRCECGDPKCETAFMGYPGTLGMRKRGDKVLAEMPSVAIYGYVALQSRVDAKST
jgi:hypothetical protein